MKTLSDIELKTYFSTPGTIALWWEPEQGRYRFFFEKELEILKDHLRLHETFDVLDAATGKGRFARWYAKKKCNVTAVDISPEMLGIAKERAIQEGVSGRIEFRHSDVETLDLDGRQFDIVSAMQFLDHVTDPSKSIQKLTQHLKKEGHLILTFVSEKSLYGKTRKIYLWLTDFFNPNFVNLSKTYRLSEIKKTLKASNIDIQSVFGIGLLSAPQERVNLPSFVRCLLEIISKLELFLKPYYRSRLFVPFTTTILVIGARHPHK